VDCLCADEQARAALQQSFARTKASDLAGFLKVAELKANSSNNTLFADDKGEIAYLHPQFVPVRDDSFRLARAGGRQQPRHRMEGAARARHTAAGDQPGQRLGLQHQQRAVERGGGDSPRKDAFPRYMDQVGPTRAGRTPNACWAPTRISRSIA
jgi:acyl-homoserine-lactone acylase